MEYFFHASMDENVFWRVGWICYIYTFYVEVFKGGFKKYI